VRLEGLGQFKKIHIIGTGSRDLPACSLVPQSTTLPRACPYELVLLYKNFDKGLKLFKSLSLHELKLTACDSVPIVKTLKQFYIDNDYDLQKEYCHDYIRLNFSYAWNTRVRTALHC
jgi:hypothetical protein